MSGCGCGGGCGSCADRAVASMPGRRAAPKAARQPWISAAEAEDPPQVRRTNRVWEVAGVGESSCGARLRSVSPASVPRAVWGPSVVFSQSTGNPGGDTDPVELPDFGSIPDELPEPDPITGDTDPYCLEYEEYVWKQVPQMYRPPQWGNIAAKPGCQPYNQPKPLPRRFQVCWGQHPVFAAAVAELERRGKAGQKQLWGSVTESGFLDVAGLQHDDFDGMMRDYMVGSSWDDSAFWGTTSLGSPRRAVMRAALWLIASMEKGVPVSYDRFDHVRDEVVGRIQQGKMKYYVFQPGEFWGDLIKATICDGPTSPLEVTTPTTFVGGSNMERCPLARSTLRLHGPILFRFGAGTGEFSLGAHHAGDIDTHTVYICSLETDRAAAVYDWFMGLAATHALAAEDPTIIEQWEDHKVARNICLRMALSAAAKLARLIVHETAHNLDLYHCAQGPRRKAGCVQDAAAWTWFWYTTARLGLPTTDFGAANSDTVFWQPLYSFPAGANGRLVDPVIECKQGSKVEPPVDQGWEIANAVVGIAAGLGATVTTGGAFVFYLSLAALAGASAAVNEEVTDALGTQANATLHFGIDQPLMMGGNLTVCVITGRPSDCADQPSTECWQTDPPEGVERCLNRPGGVLDASSEGLFRVS
jgi:hypothetical protein